MKLNLNWNGTKEPTDGEIERDVAELRQLLARVEEPAEPHPAYWQNFLVHVRTRVDEDRARRRWAPSMAWTSVAAAMLVVVVAVSGVLPMRDEPNGRPEVPATGRVRPVKPMPLYSEAGESLMLSDSEVEMLDAIVVEKSPEAVLAAMIEQGS
jgi:hypothetical protein